MDNFYDALAKHYDVMQSDMDAASWAEFISMLIARHYEGGEPASSITDLGCGTGSVTIELADKSYSVIGIDSAEEMLSMASAKDGAENVTWLAQDITDFDIAGTSDVFISTLDTVDHITDGDVLAGIFERVAECLNPGGLFIYDAITMHHLRDTLGDNIFYEDYEEFTLLWQNEFDEDTLVNTAYLTLFTDNGEGLYERFDGELVEKFYPEEELIGYANKAGLVLLGRYGELKDSEPEADEERIFYVFAKQGE